MQSVLTAVRDENLLNRIKVLFNSSSTLYYYADSVQRVVSVASSHEIACFIVDFSEDFEFGEELCETIYSINTETRIIAFFDEKDTGEIVSVYNRLHLFCLMCRQQLVLEKLPDLVEKCFKAYYREEGLEGLDTDLKEFTDKYMVPMQEMSNVLNERLSGYGSIIRVFKKSVDFIVNSKGKALKSIDIFVDRIISDFIQLYMIKEPDFNLYCDNLRDSFNIPEQKKYFMFNCEDIEADSISGDAKVNLLFILDVVTIGFDVFYPYYRGKITVSKTDNRIEVNALYEVRLDKEILDVYRYILSVMRNTIMTYSNDCRFAVKDSMIQFKSIIVCD